jgi:hypothetical protein
MPNDPWYSCLPSCETLVPCGQGRHVVRWTAGQLRLPEHPDAEAELVLAALGGEKAGCVRLAEAWGRHTRDLSVLAIGPRGPADEISVSWEDVEEAAQAGSRSGSAMFRPGPALRRPVRQLAVPPAAAASQSARQRQADEEMERARERRNDMLSLLALGYGFQIRLAGQVAAAHAGGPEVGATDADGPETGDPGTGGPGVGDPGAGDPGAGDPGAGDPGAGDPGAGDPGAGDPGAGGPGAGGPEASVRPALVAAIAGRLGLVAEQWLGIDPDQVAVSLYRGAGWGAVELTGRGAQRRLQVSLPANWLARVWACGLALTGGHLVVAVDQAGWPDARVLALRAPGNEPVRLDVHAREDGRGDGRDGPHDAPHWEV